MKKRLVFILGFFPVLLFGQDLSVQDLIRKKEESIVLKQFGQKVLNQGYERNILRLDKLPVIYADANVQRNIIIPTTPVPAIAFDPSAKEGAILPLKFATKWNAKAGFQLEWQLFNPSTKSKLIDQQLKTEKEELTYAKEEVTWQKDAILAYAAVVLATEQYQIALTDSSNFAQILQTVQNRFQEGRVQNSEYITAQQELERKILLRKESWAVLQEANLELNSYSNLDEIQYLSSNLEDIEGFIKQQVFDSYEIQLLQTEKQITLNQNLDIRRQLLPSLTLNGFYGQQYFSNNLNLVAKDGWYGSSFINLAVRIPISAYFSQGVGFRKVALQEQLLEYQIREEEANELNDLKRKQVRVWNLKERILGLQKIEKLAIALEQEKLHQLDAGRILISDYQQVNSSVLKAKQDIWQAQYDLINELLK